MKTRTVTVLAAALCAALGSSSQAAGDPKTAAADQGAAQLLALEARLSAAVEKNDAAVIANLLNDDWMIIDSDGGSVDKTRFLVVIKSGDLTNLKIETREPRVRIYGNSAVVTEHSRTTGTFKGSLFTTDELATDFLVKSHGQWKFVFSQLTRANGAP